jgi:predicted nucleic acid-binding protein
VTLVDTGPLVALFDPKDPDHALCSRTLEGLPGLLVTTTPVLTESFHLLDPKSPGSKNLRLFVERGGLTVAFLDETTLSRSLSLMQEHSARGMDLADASLVAVAENRQIRRVFTLDRRDFRVYKARFGHRQERLQVVP